MYLFDLLFRLPPDVDVRIRFHGTEGNMHFRTGTRNTVKFAQEVADEHGHMVKVDNIFPLWGAHELYIECG